MTFWRQVLVILSAVNECRPDQAHAATPGILSLGALGATFASGDAATLLYHCMRRDPVRYMDKMSGAMTASQTVLYPGRRGMRREGAITIGPRGVRNVVVLGSDGKKWTSPQKDRAHAWVASCSALLACPEMLDAQADFLEEVLPTLLIDDMKARLGFPRHADGWGHYSEDIRALWILGMMLKLVNPKDALFAIVNVNATGTAARRAHDLALSAAGYPALRNVVPIVVGMLQEAKLWPIATAATEESHEPWEGWSDHDREQEIKNAKTLGKWGGS